MSFTELLLGCKESGFSLDDEVLPASYVPMDPVTVPMGGLGAGEGGSFDVEALVASASQPQSSVSHFWTFRKVQELKVGQDIA